LKNAEIVKEANDAKRKYFQKTGITKTGFFIIIAVLVLILIGIIVSGMFLESPANNL